MPVKLGNNNLTFSGISEIYVGSNKVYSATPVDYSTEYFFVENLTNSDNTLTISKSYSSAPTITVYYSTDKTNWTSVSTSSSTTVNIPSGSKVFLKSSDGKWASNTAYWNYVACSNDFGVGGNIMSLISGDNFIGSTLTNSNALANLFNGRTSLKNIDKLVLGSTTLTRHCYYRMFNGCTSLTSVPSNLLPATSLATNCYQEMFKGCTGITNVPDLPSTALTTYCYADMFNGCTSLTSVPSNLLPATSTQGNCYRYMFSGCTSLTNVPDLPSTALTPYCYAGMFTNCTGITSIPSNFLPATTLGTYCYNEMFNGCTGLTTLASTLLPATTLASTCYRMMFSGCTGLTSIPSNFLPATTLGNNCYQFMFKNCTGITNVPPDLLPATTLGTYCYGGMFLGCSSITTAPTLPATTLAQYCYKSMFQDCSSLNEITCYANDISATNCTNSWVSGVASSGTFYKRGDAAWTTGNNGIPTGWTVIDDRPYNPINDYFWIENRKSSSDTIQFTFITNLTNSKFHPTIAGDVSDFFYYSTDKSTWTSHTGTSLTIPANTRYYFYSNRSEGFNQQSGYVSSGIAFAYFKSFSGIMAAAKINGSFQPTLYANLGFGGNASSNFAIGGNIRTLLGKGTGGVGDTSLIERGTKQSLAVGSYNECKYVGYTALGTSSTSFSKYSNDIGLFFTGITDAGNLYIGNSDHEAEFSLITPTTLPIYT